MHPKLKTDDDCCCNDGTAPERRKMDAGRRKNGWWETKDGRLKVAGRRWLTEDKIIDERRMMDD